MDDRLQRALEQANYNLTLQTQKKNHQLRYQNAITYAVHGGAFTITQQLVAFVDALVRNQHTEAVLIDDRGNPILVPDLAEFLTRALAIYHEAANELRLNTEQLRKARTTTKAVGL